MMKQKGKKAIRTMALVMVALASALALAGCSENEANKPREGGTIRPVKTVLLSGADENASWTFPGMVRSLRDADLSFRVGGPVVALTVDRGQKVRKGEVIARIDPRDFEVAVETLTANLAVSKAQLKEAERQYRRYETLSASNAAAQATFDSIIAAYEVARASADAAAKRLEDAKNILADTTLIAPFDGYVHRKYSDNHETVAQGQPVVSLVDLDHMEVEVAVPEGMLSIIPETASYECKFDALPGEKVSASFKELSKNPNPSNRSYPLYLTLDGNSDHRIRPGMATEVTLTALHKEDGVLVPATAVVNTGQTDSFVWVVDSDTMAARKVTVRLIGANASGLRVDGPLKEGLRVIAAGARGLSEGQQVRLLPEPSPTNIGGEL